MQAIILADPLSFSHSSRKHAKRHRLWHDCTVKSGLNSLQQRAWISLVAGSSIAVGLFLLSYSARWHFFFWPQAIGFYACLLARGIHASTKADFAAIAIPVNAAIYSVVIFGLLHTLARLSKTDSPPDPLR